VPAGRVVTFLEGGYSLPGLRDSIAACIPVLAGGDADVPEGEEATSGGPGDRVDTAVGELWQQRRTG
jgi:acetoin utilization deacetylase AcuC-like enzyme